MTRSYDTINQVSVCNFLKALREKNPDGEKLYFILDRGPSNTALSVRELAKELNIEIVFLPAYSPNLNPIERLWKFFKKKVLYNQYYEKFKDFKSVCASFFRGIRKYELELDLAHVNYGLNKKKELNTKPRSHFTVHDVVSIFESLDGVVFEPERDEEYEYFMVDKVFMIHRKKLKLVFCIEILAPDTAGVITLYILKKGIKR